MKLTPALRANTYHETPAGAIIAPRYVKPNYKIKDVNAAARQLARALTTHESEFGQSLEIMENWRASHALPLNTFYMTLKRRAARIHASAIIAQRLKTLGSIALKLINEGDLKLSQMQDIGGCRAVLPKLGDVQALHDRYRAHPGVHRFIGEENYIANPKPSGYRSIHLKYRFTGRGNSAPWNNLRIEIQLRTLLQHRWATAAEAVGVFTQQALKSNKASEHWLRFLALMGSVYALREGCCTIPGTPATMHKLREQVRRLDAAHHILNVLTQYREIAPTIAKQTGAKYYLVTLDPVRQVANIEGFKAIQSRAANRAYTRVERDLPKTMNVMLLSSSSIGALIRAYPNFFLETRDFLADVADTIGRR